MLSAFALLMTTSAIQSGNAFAFRTTHDIGNVTTSIISLLRIVSGRVTVDATRVS